MPETIATEQSARELRPVKLWPILAAVGILLSALIVDSVIVAFAIHFMGKTTFNSMPWKILYFGHTGMLLVAVLWIGILSGWRFREFGFKAPADRRYVWFAWVFGVFFGLIFVRSHEPQDESHRNENRRRDGSCTTFGEESRYFSPPVLCSHPPAASTFFTHSDLLL